MATRPYHQSIPEEILALSHERDLLRRRGQYARADALKQQIEDAGYVIKDNPHGAHLIVLPSIDVDGTVYRTARQLPSLLDEPDRFLFSVNVLAQDSFEQTRRCIESIFRCAGDTSLEVILIDNASQDGLDLWAETYKYEEPRLHLIRPSRAMGAAEVRNLGLKQSRGRYILLLDTYTELTGDIFAPLAQTLADTDIGITGLHGLHTDDLRHFEETQDDTVEAIDTVCMAFRRDLLTKTGLFDEGYRFPYFMDIDFNFAVRETGAAIAVTRELPLRYEPVPANTGKSDAERLRLTKRNFYRFLDKWGDRDDLLPGEDEEDA